MIDYVNPIPEEGANPVEVKQNEQRTPKRITIMYQTTGIFQDISQESKNEVGANIPG